MSNKKQTTVEWLIEKLQNRQNGIFDGFPHLSLDEIYNQAKELQKQQHEETATHMVNYASHCILNLKESDFEKEFDDYYTEIYGGKNG